MVNHVMTLFLFAQPGTPIPAIRDLNHLPFFLYQKKNLDLYKMLFFKCLLFTKFFALKN